MTRPAPYAVLLALTTLGLTGASVGSAASIYHPDGLNPGDQYRLVFQTSSRRDATSQDINDYNAFVTAEATAPGSLIEGLSTKWRAIASTRTVDAIDNTATDPSPLGPTGVPIYQIDGLTRVADNYDDLWDGSVASTIYQNPFPEFGTELNWTGTGPDGTAQLPLGGDTVNYGLITTLDSGWIAWDDLFMTDLEASMYGISGVLTVVPEPGSGSIVGLGLLGVVASRRRRGA
ncbi:hypothetical protein MalM25_30220 [Planctomycetes bacterium MalM25]|nr:hypothetical protein MalM25_30220 [Planctomycetes bacterium MalM25]